jgi:NifU-like protein
MTPFFKPFIWHQYSKSLKAAILSPSFVGSISEEEAELSDMRLVVGTSGRARDGVIVKIYLLVSEEDGLIVDIKFQAFGETLLIGALDILCGMSLRKNYDQASKISAELLSGKGEFPVEAKPYLQLAVSALFSAAQKCGDIPFASSYVPPVPFEKMESGEAIYPNFLELSLEQKMAVLSKVIDEDIRPYVELDAGGVDVTKVDGYQITITYKGSCTSCYSSIGATLTGIQSILRAKVNPFIEVIPDASTLNF